MSDNKFIKRLKGEQTAKSVLEIKNESAKTSFANMPQGTSNAINVYSDHRGNATAVLNGTTNWKVSNSDLLLADIISGDGQDFTSTYSVSGAGLWVNASYTFPSTGDPRHPVAMVFNPSTKWVLKVCGDNLIVDGGSTVDFTMLVKIGTSNVYSKNFTIRESAGQFSKEFVIDFGEANSDVVKAGGLSTLTVQLLCGTANASARIYNGMTVLTCLQRKVDASAVSNSSANVEDVLDGNIIPSDYFSNPEFIDEVEDGEDAYAVFTRDGDDINLSGWTPKDEIARKEEIIVKSDTIPTATADLVGSVYQYVGTTDSSYTHGYIYECVSDGQEPATYTWERINVQPGTEVIDNLTSTSSTSALSANQGRILNDRIDDVSGRGRFLALWNCATGLAESNPPESPYPYKAGDYFVVGTVSSADPAVNYKPDGSSYTTGVASTTVETNEVSVNDTYFYDGTVWKLQSNAQKEVSFSALAGSPYDNTNLSNALNAKADASALTAHTSNTNNPHSVTKAQVGLGNVDNTSDLNKPISTATQTALGGKQDVILDLATIRSGAGLGATALQPNDNISELNNDAGYTTNVGTVTSVNNTQPDANGNVTISTASAVSDLTDVQLTNLTDGQTLVYDSSSSKWVNGNGGVSASYDSTTKTITFA